MSSAAAEFWRSMDRHHDLAEQFERNIERTHPGSVTSDRIGCGWCYHCIWGASCVIYHEYRGPSI